MENRLNHDDTTCDEASLALEAMVDVLKAIAEPSRLRILLLLRHSNLTVSDLTQILGQSQPRVSRHLRLLHEAQMIERYQEGAWAYFALSECVLRKGLINSVTERLNINDLAITHDLERLEQVKQQRRQNAARYFSKNAAHWDDLRLLHIDDTTIEKTMVEIVGNTPFQAMLDIGTGTASLLKLFAPLYTRAVGVDINRDMLSVARVNLDHHAIQHAQVRLGDVSQLPVERESFDFVTIYQVLHFLDDPQMALREASRVMRAGARLIVVDFAPHDLEFLREHHAHLRLGFSDQQMKNWLEESGLNLEKTISFAPTKSGDAKGLTVKLWLARDPRLLMAMHKPPFMEIA
ncbi:ArsR/SmtB family transcription factor [Bartonella tamiae]|uniref:HTH arsR-type domain-containing protein n=1 Tax=Bartonella tamiae Th239 TaxID=1094558 RepID=J1JWW0_9HYPH|nr:metalloregulator ArsR/SmtB family transcription factor [Bartonella tamiae]EJF89080.1 hypothetical protein ME5_01631 [Bartonella tamiae Th239]EJF94670.1 hypothetical protein MEG_00251 [Bartonella tamiae Th307]